MSSVLKLVNQTFSSNSYLCATPVAGECIIVDPGLDSAPIDAKIVELGLKPVGIFCTHGHFDHVGTADFFKKKYGIPLHLHRADVKLSKSSNFLLMACKINARITIPTVDIEIDIQFNGEVDGEAEINVSGEPLRFVHVPGHTPGSCFIEYRGALFTGDSMYRNAVGLVDFPGENPEQLRQSLLRIWDRFPESHVVYPGHGSFGSLGEIKQENRKLRQFLGLDAVNDGSMETKRVLLGAEARKAFSKELEGEVHEVSDEKLK